MAVKKSSVKKINKSKKVKPDEYINPFLKSSPTQKDSSSFNLEEFLSQGMFNNKK